MAEAAVTRGASRDGVAVEEAALAELAKRHAVRTSYVDTHGRTRTASPDALLAVLEALGVPVERVSDAPEAIRRGEAGERVRLAPPAVVAWLGQPGRVPLALEPGEERRGATCRIETEAGEAREWRVEGAMLETDAAVPLPVDLPAGYHELAVAVNGRTASTLVIAAPPAAYDPAGRGWDVFLPLYALRSARSRGIADLTDLEALLDWVSGLGASGVATLPLFAAYLDRPFDPSPYAPVSRLFWNELYLDPSRSPELALAPATQALLASDDVRREIDRLRSSPLVDYREVAALARRMLEPLAEAFFDAGRDTWDPFRSFAGRSPEIDRYARFRAAVEAHGGDWRSWPEGMRAGTIEPGRYSARSADYHRYVQWLADRQLSELAGRATANGAGLSLDLPLGVHPDGFDAWRFQDRFAARVSAGAPPDDFFAGGQDWGFPPLHPERIRETGYAYVRAALATACRHASTLRIDHAMGLHRLFWVPHGMAPTEGVYVEYPAEELWAILCLESARHATRLVGEDLGTVPTEVREAMSRHAVGRMYVAPFELVMDGQARLAPVPERSWASLGTHDMPPFAGLWESRDDTWRQAFAAAIGADRAAPDAALRAALHHLAESPARRVIVNLEDLWLEECPQNEPGTTSETNWRRQARHTLERITAMDEVVEPLREIDRRRRIGDEAG